MTGLDVEAVLRKHFWNHSDEHYAHVAAILRVEIESALEDAWDEGWECCADLVQDGGTFKDYYNNPYRASLAATEGDRQ